MEAMRCSIRARSVRESQKVGWKEGWPGREGRKAIPRRAMGSAAEGEGEVSAVARVHVVSGGAETD